MAITKRNLVSKFGFTDYKGELLKYMTPKHLLIVKGNFMFVSDIGGNSENDKVVCTLDNFSEGAFAIYLSKTINGYVKIYRQKK